MTQNPASQSFAEKTRRCLRAISPAEPLFIYDAREAAQIAGIPLSTFLRKIKDGQIPAIKNGEKWRFSLAVLRACRPE